MAAMNNVWNRRWPRSLEYSIRSLCNSVKSVNSLTNEINPSKSHPSGARSSWKYFLKRFITWITDAVLSHECFSTRSAARLRSAKAGSMSTMAGSGAA